MSTRKEYTFDRVVRIIFTTLFFAGVIWLITLLKNALLPFLVACLIAYIFEPFVQYNRRLLHLKGRITATFVTLFEVLFLFCLVITFISPIVISQISEMSTIMRQYASTELRGGIIPIEVHQFLKGHIDQEFMSKLLTQLEWKSIFENVVNTIQNVISGSVDFLLGFFNWLLVLIYLIFIMIDYERLARGFRRLVPKAYRKVTFTLANDIKQSMNQYFRGQATVAFIVGILFAIGFTIIDLPLAILLGLFIGVLNLVPYLQLISIIPVSILCIISSASGETDLLTLSLECFAVYCIVQVIQDMYLVPKIMGKTMGLNPAIILLSLSIWGTLLGFIGLIIALPLTTLLLSYYNRFILSDKNPGDCECNSSEASEPADSTPKEL